MGKDAWVLRAGERLRVPREMMRNAQGKAQSAPERCGAPGDAWGRGKVRGARRCPAVPGGREGVRGAPSL